jgi:hypothetical protein
MKNYLFAFSALVLLVAGASCKKTPAPTPPSLPTVTTTAIVQLDITSITSGGTVLDDGGGNVTQRGVCWATQPYPTINDSLTNDGGGTGPFNSLVTTLKPNTAYYLRAYAINAAGVAYGLQQTIQTSDLVVGDTYQGGIVCYIFKSGEKGYIDGRISGIILSKQRDSVRAWGCLGTDILGLSDQVGYGKLNTQTIAKRCSDPSYAAEYCDKLVYNGYSDWFLPSINELLECSKIYPLPSGQVFWTSTQKDANNGVIAIKGSASALSGWGTKAQMCIVQPARYFSTP